jgi:isocitrate dehydrogenase
MGVDLFVHWNGEDAETLASAMQRIELSHIKLSMITILG